MSWALIATLDQHTRFCTEPPLKYVVTTTTLTGLTSLNVFGRKQPYPDYSRRSHLLGDFFFLPTRNTHLPPLSLAPQSLLVGCWSCCLFLLKSSRHWGLQQVFSSFLNGLLFQGANQLEIFSFPCISSILSCLFLFNRFILQQNSDFLYIMTFQGHN